MLDRAPFLGICCIILLLFWLWTPSYYWVKHEYKPPLYKESFHKKPSQQVSMKLSHIYRFGSQENSFRLAKIPISPIQNAQHLDSFLSPEFLHRMSSVDTAALRSITNVILLIDSIHYLINRNFGGRMTCLRPFPKLKSGSSPYKI